jgi:hypothetical protein
VSTNDPASPGFLGARERWVFGLPGGIAACCALLGLASAVYQFQRIAGEPVIALDRRLYAAGATGLLTAGLGSRLAAVTWRQTAGWRVLARLVAAACMSAAFVVPANALFEAARRATYTHGFAAALALGAVPLAATAAAPVAPAAARPGSQVADTGQEHAVFRDHRSDGSDCSACPEMVVVPAGHFTMGATAYEEERTRVERQYRGRSLPLTEVRITRPFALGRYPVTRAQYAAFVVATGRLPEAGCLRPSRSPQGLALDPDATWQSPGFAQTDDHPAVCVSWDDAQAYVQWLAAVTGEGYRLPPKPNGNTPRAPGPRWRAGGAKGLAAATRAAAIAAAPGATAARPLSAVSAPTSSGSTLSQYG